MTTPHPLQHRVFHEAGHIVIHFLMGLGDMTISLGSTDDYATQVVTSFPLWVLQGYSSEHRLTQATTLWSQRQIAALYAGCIAEKVYTGSADVHDEQRDATAIENIAVAHFASDLIGRGDDVIVLLRDGRWRQIERTLCGLGTCTDELVRRPDVTRGIGAAAEEFARGMTLSTSAVAKFFD